MALNFDNICRLCMVQNELLLPLFGQDATNLPARIMTLAPNVKVGWFRIKLLRAINALVKFWE